MYELRKSSEKMYLAVDPREAGEEYLDGQVGFIRWNQ